MTEEWKVLEMVLKTTNDYKMQTQTEPVENYDRPVLVTDTGIIIDGNGRYLSHLVYGTPIKYEVLQLSPSFYVPLDKLVFEEDIHNHIHNVQRSEQDWHDITSLPIIIDKINSLWRVYDGLNRILRYMEQDRTHIRAREIL